MKDAAAETGRRIVVTGMAGSGNSAFSVALAAKSGLPLVHLDLEFWEPGWVEPSEPEWREKQRGLRRPDRLPEGCAYTAWQRLRDEWRLIPIIWRVRRTEIAGERAIIARHGQHATRHVLESKRAIREFLDDFGASP